MKILQVNCVFSTGSTGKIVAAIHEDLLRRGCESVVCYGRGRNVTDPYIYKTCGEWYSKSCNLLTRFTGLMYGGCRYSTNKLISIIRKEKPDVVHLHCLNGYFVNVYRLIRWLKENEIKTVLTLHAEFMYTANCGLALDCEKWRTGCGCCPRRKQETRSFLLDGTSRSWKAMRLAFEGFEKDCVVTSVSPWLTERAKQSPILGRFSHETVLNGVDTEGAFHPGDGTEVRRKLGLGDAPMILHVTSNFSGERSHIKGGWYVLELARRMPESAFVIVGGRKRIKDLPANVYDAGRIEDQRELANYYSAADVMLLTSRRESFSMVVAESLCCGTPVVGFRAGAPEQIALREYSSFVEHGNLSRLTAETKEMIRRKRGGAVEHEKALAMYSGAAMCRRYVEIYERLCAGRC